MLKKILVFAIGSGLAASAWRALSGRLRHQRSARLQQAEREQIRRWEDEGGAVAPPADRH